MSDTLQQEVADITDDVDDDGFVLVLCQCDSILGRFNTDDDHGFVYIKCSKCGRVMIISNNQLMEANGGFGEDT